MCLKPNTAYENPDGGRPIFGWEGVKRGLREIKIPCQKCSECIYDYYSYWATRGYYELLNWPPGTCWFCTFTLDNDHLPGDHSLDKRMFQKFLKKVKKKYGSSKANPIRQIYTGEYGEQNSRPHYHAILFNIELSDLEESRVTDQGYKCYVSPTMAKLWGRGSHEISEASPALIAYLFKYILKKKTRKEKEKPLIITTPDGISYDVAHEFIEPSRNPGIGACLRESPSIRKGFLSVEGVPRSLPKYFLEYLKHTDPKFYEELKQQRFDHAIRQPVLSAEEKNRRDAVYKKRQSLQKRD